MANNKDFIVKNGIEVSGPTKITVGDAATGGSVNFKLNSASYDNVSLDVSSQTILPLDIFFKPDGTKMFTTGLSGSTYTINEYSLSTAYDLSTASFTQSFSTASQETTPRSIWFKDDGTKMFLLGAAGDDVNEYTLSTAWSLTSVTHVDSFSVASQDTAPTGLTFSADGTQMYTCGLVEDDVIQYTLSTAWDVSSASYTRNLVITTVEPNPRDVQFNSDGTAMFISGRTNGLHKYTLTTAYDISTATFDSTSSITTDTQSEPWGFFIKSDGSKMWVGDGTDKTIYQYSTTVTTGSFDLSTGNYFTDTPSADVEYTFSNAGGVQSFQLEITGGAVGFNLSNAALDSGQELSFSVYETSPSMAAVSGDGQYIYVAGTSAVGCSINSWQMSTPYDLTTASYWVNYNVSQAPNPDALGFSSDGTKMWVGQSGTVYQYTLSTAWQVNTASYDSKTLSSGTTITGVSASNDGTKFYVVDDGGNRIREHTLTTANDIDTAGSATTFSTSGQTTSPAGGEISSDGLKFYIAGGGVIYEYDLSTANDISTASYNSVSFDTGYSVTEGMGITTNGFYIFIAESNNDKFRRISMSKPISITWSTSIEWSVGTAPDSPANGEKDIYTFTTDDGGTTYIGVQSGDAFS